MDFFDDLFFYPYIALRYGPVHIVSVSTEDQLKALGRYLVMVEIERLINANTA